MGAKWLLGGPWSIWRGPQNEKKSEKGIFYSSVCFVSFFDRAPWNLRSAPERAVPPPKLRMANLGPLKGKHSMQAFVKSPFLKYAPVFCGKFRKTINECPKIFQAEYCPSLLDRLGHHISVNALFVCLSVFCSHLEACPQCNFTR